MTNFEKIKQELTVETYIAMLRRMCEPCDCCKEYHKEVYDNCKPLGSCEEETRRWLNAEVNE